jgi:hypothetical protein
MIRYLALALAVPALALASEGDVVDQRSRDATYEDMAREAARPERGHAPHDYLRTEAAGRSRVRMARDEKASEGAAERTTRGTGVTSASAARASGVQHGCSTRFVRNRSSRGGARPSLLVMHFTVSPNRPGRGDVDGVTKFFNNPRVQASSNYVTDAEGNCNYIVPEAAKAWTQGAFNPWAISWEVINTGREQTYAGEPGGPGLAKLGLTLSDAARRWGIPLRRGATSGCRILRSGIVDHESLDCGNNHTDIRPFRVDEVIKAAKARRG